MGFTVTSVFLTSLFILFISVTVLQNTVTAIESSVSIIGRSLVTLDSLDAAKEQAKAQAKYMLGGYKNCKSIRTKVDFLPGYNKWEKGSFIRLTVSAKVKTYDPLTTRRHKYSTVVMVEKNSKEQLGEESIDDLNQSMGSSETARFIECLESVAKIMCDEHFRYAEDVAYAKRFSKAIENKPFSNSQSFISWAMQDFGYLEQGEMITIDSDIHGSGADKIKGNSDQYQIIHPKNLIPSNADLQVGDICGFKLQVGSDYIPFAAVVKDISASGKIFWIAAGTNACSGDTYTESKFIAKRLTKLETTPVLTIIRLRQEIS